MFSNNGIHVTQHSLNEHSGLNGRREDNEFEAVFSSSCCFKASLVGLFIPCKYLHI